MGQAFNKQADKGTIRIISDNPSITTGELLAKLGGSLSSIQYRIQRMCDDKRVFRQTKKAFNGSTYHLFTMAYARKNHIPRIYVDKDEKSTLEQQMWFNDISRGVA